jgi:hypothetical protein
MKKASTEVLIRLILGAEKLKELNIFECNMETVYVIGTTALWCQVIVKFESWMQLE